MTENSNSTSVMTEVTTLIRNWEDEHGEPNYDPIQTLTRYDAITNLTLSHDQYVRLAEICEVETENYLKMDPDPFDERHPSRTDPDCKLGQILKALFRKDNFMNKVRPFTIIKNNNTYRICFQLVNDYLRDSYYSRTGVVAGRDVDQLNIAACRLMLDVMPGLETSVVFQVSEKKNNK